MKKLLFLVLFLCTATAPVVCQTVDLTPISLSNSRTIPDGTALAGGVLAGQTASKANNVSSLYLLSDAHESFEARLMLINNATQSIDVQYYIFRPDSSGLTIANALHRAARRGVKVRLLLDGWGAGLDESLLQYLTSEPSIEVRLFNPLLFPRLPWLSLLVNFEMTQRRMHNKLLVADRLTGILGGRNVGDEYFEKRQEFTFADVDVMVTGPAVNQMSVGFDAYWSSPYAKDVSTLIAYTANEASSTVVPDALADAEFSRKLKAGEFRRFDGIATAIQDLPGKINPVQSDEQSSLGNDIAQVMGNVHTELLIVSPYFVPGKGGVAQLREMTERGVRVTVVTNSLAATDVPAVHAGYARYRTDLLRAGIQLHEVRADAFGPRMKRKGTGSSRVSLHAKVIVVDRSKTFIGSMNIDPRSIRLNTENGLVVEHTDLATELAQGIERQLPTDTWQVQLLDDEVIWKGLHDSEAHSHTSEPLAGFWLRLGARLMSLLPIERLL